MIKKIIRILTFIIFSFSYVYLFLFWFVLTTTNYQKSELDINGDSILSFKELYKFIDTAKRLKCFTLKNELKYINLPLTRKKINNCKELKWEYYNFKDGLGFYSRDFFDENISN